MEQLGDLQKRYLKLLSEKYPTIASASTEIINLSAIMNLPKGTEHALSDIHGEADQFFHVLKNGSGAVRAKIDEEFGNSISMKEAACNIDLLPGEEAGAYREGRGRY